MKKLFAVIAVLAVMLSFAGCGGTKYEVSDYDTAATNDLVQLIHKAAHRDRRDRRSDADD